MTERIHHDEARAETEGQSEEAQATVLTDEVQVHIESDRT